MLLAKGLREGLRGCLGLRRHPTLRLDRGGWWSDRLWVPERGDRIEAELLELRQQELPPRTRGRQPSQPRAISSEPVAGCDQSGRVVCGLGQFFEVLQNSNLHAPRVLPTSPRAMRGAETADCPAGARSPRGCSPPSSRPCCVAPTLGASAPPGALLPEGVRSTAACRPFCA